MANHSGNVLLARILGRGWEPVRLLSIDSRVTPPEMLVQVFACRLVGGAPRAREATVPEAGWFAPAEARRLVTRFPAAERLRDALELEGVRHRTYRLLPFESPSAEVSD